MAIGRDLGSRNIGVRGKTDAPVSRADKRMAAIKASMQAAKTTAKSAAHTGVVARPMDKNLSKMLEQRRAQMKESGTSVARLGKEVEPRQQGSSNAHRPGEETNDKNASSVARLDDAAHGSTSAARLNEANSSEGLATRGTSAARLGKGKDNPSYLPPPPQKPFTKPTTQPPVDLFGDM